jgi:hypothetical protein
MQVVGALGSFRVAPEQEEHDDELEGLANCGTLTIGERGGGI